MWVCVCVILICSLLRILIVLSLAYFVLFDSRFLLWLLSLQCSISASVSVPVPVLEFESRTFCRSWVQPVLGSWLLAIQYCVDVVATNVIRWHCYFICVSSNSIWVFRGIHSFFALSVSWYEWSICDGFLCTLMLCSI